MSPLFTTIVILNKLSSTNQLILKEKKNATPLNILKSECKFKHKFENWILKNILHKSCITEISGKP